MKKKKLLFVAILIMGKFIFAQYYNVNPDADGEQWLVLDGEFHESFINDLSTDLPELELTESSLVKQLPYSVDNSQKKYFRDIFSQTGPICYLASEIGYIYTYEINRLRDADAADSINRYPTHYFYNYMIGDKYDSLPSDSLIPIYYTNWERLKINGCPNIKDWGGMVGNPKQWLTGYNKYYNGMHNHSDSCWKLIFEDEDDLNILKHWINDHAVGDSTGGLSSFMVHFDSATYFSTGVLPPESEFTGDLIQQKWGLSGGHFMTFVGYNDSVMFDFNGDSLFTNNLDINGDDTIDMQDWEIGALKIANSWGPNIWNDGYIWMPYNLLATPYDSGGVQNNLKVFSTLYNHEPEITFKVKMEHENRQKIRILTGISSNPYSIEPQIRKNTLINYCGGEYPMQGQNNFDPIELGLDITNKLSLIENPCKYFLEIIENDGNNSDDGIIHYFSIYDYYCGNGIEIPLDTSNVVITNNDTTLLYIYYNPIPSTIDYDTIVNIDAAVRCTTYVSGNSTLSFDDNIIVDFYKSTLIVEEGSKLIIDDNVTFKSITGNNEILVYGEIEIGENLTIAASDSSEFKFDIKNKMLDIEITGANFNKTTISGYSKTLTIDDSNFDRGSITFKNADINISETNFDASNIKVSEGAGKSSYCYIFDCYFTHFNGNPVYIYSYPQFAIDSSIISNNSLDGICIYYSGSKPDGKHSISYNTIEDNGQNSAGIKLYQTDAFVHNNYSISGNNIGVLCLNNSNIRLQGNKLAGSVSNTQYIHDNYSNQVYATQGSFPYYFSWNAVVDENNTVPLVYYSTIASEELDVRNNYWGENFNYQEDFYPYADYIYIPVWDLGGGDEEGEAAAMYNSAQTSISNEDYSGAKSQLQQIVTTYPTSKYAQASLRELFTLEEFATDDYTELKSYYNTNQVIQNNSDLLKLADYLANYCEIKLENYPTAISWFENIIQNPETIEDSVFAIIDLGYTYFLMENGGLKSAYTGTMTEHKPVSVKQYEDKRDYLLSLIFKDSEIPNQFENDLQRLKPGELLQNIPNPYKNNTRIWYKLENESIVEINVYNNTGQLIKIINEGTITKGTHYIDFDATGLKNGIYFYSISINGQITNSKKMTIIK